MKKLFFLFWMLFAVVQLNAQASFPVNGSHDVRPNKFALTNATITTSATKKIEKATLLIDGQEITYVGKNKSIPKGYVVYNMEGKYIYPSFIDAFSTYGVEQPKEDKSASWRSPQVFESQKDGAYNWNAAIRPETQAYKSFSIDSKEADELHKLGFGAVQSLVKDGIARGSATVVSLAKTKDNEVVLKSESAAHYSFDKGTSKNSYPSSIMGSVALLRQTYYDTQWYNKQGEEHNISLEEFGRLQELPQFFEANQLLDLFRIDRIAKEFDIKYILKSAGDEYQRLAEVKALNMPLIVPLNFPDAEDVSNPLEANNIALSKLKHWEMAPANLSALAKENINFSITTSGLKKQKDFWKNLRKAIAHGLTEEQALEALTLAPAKLLNMADKLGSLEKGKLANFLITDNPIFEKETSILENWVQGNRYILQESSGVDLLGTYELANGNLSLKIEGTSKKYKATIESAKAKTVEGQLIVDDKLFSLRYKPEDKVESIAVQGYIASLNPIKLQGKIYHADGSTSDWSAKRTKEHTAKSKDKQNKAETPELGKLVYPFVAYGNETLPQAQEVVFKNVTAWTNEEEGVVENVDVHIRNGKIHAIGKNLSARGSIVIDGTGKHLTPGIIDEHSHIALQSVNEGAQVVSSEVRMSDALNSEDIAIYRQLAGGVTTSHLLHGSANPIGGQSQLIKLRWGNTPAGLYFGDNPETIKFALGENVKQTNWSVGGQRFPQTRMGVEQVFVDAFTRAAEYKAAMAKDKQSVRRNLELDAIVEILDEQRHITCHSYVQSEINMLMNVADRMNFKINTFTHILEGYKLADKMAERGIAGATFSDWWAYKMEVADAIPYNASLMHEQGVLTAINSDDAEMGRRLNQEAAKVVKYGGTSEEDAFKMVTLNPAKMLHIDDSVGSLKVGKDADVVLWSDHPLSVYAKTEQTYIEGVKYWDINDHEAKVKEIERERSRIINKMLEEKSKKPNNTKAKKDEDKDAPDSDLISQKL